MKYSFLIAMCLIVAFANAQVTFQKTFGHGKFDYGYSVCQTSDGGYMVAGYSFNTPDYFLELIKTDGNGDTVFTRIIYCGISGVIPSEIEQTMDGGFIISAWNGLISGGGYLIKTGASGNIVWIKSYKQYESRLNSVKQLPDGGYIAAGSARKYNGSYQDLLIIRTDSNGDTLWTKTIGDSIRSEGAEKMILTNDGNFLFGCNSTDNNYTKSLLIKTDTLGNIIFKKLYGGYYSLTCFSVVQTPDSGYAFTGYVYYPSTGTLVDILLIRTNDIGDTLWTTSYGDSSEDYGRSLTVLMDGSLIIAGEFEMYSAGTVYSYNAYLMKTNQSGNATWTMSYFGGNWKGINFVKPTSDYGFIMTGQFQDGVHAGSAELLLLKTDSIGLTGCLEQPKTFIEKHPQMHVTNPALLHSGGCIVTNENSSLVYGDTVRNACDPLSTSEKPAKSNSFTLSPNPATSTITIHSDNGFNKATIRIEDITGREMFFTNVTTDIQHPTFNIQHLSSGVYFVCVKTNEGSAVRKFVKE